MNKYPVVIIDRFDIDLKCAGEYVEGYIEFEELIKSLKGADISKITDEIRIKLYEEYADYCEENSISAAIVIFENEDKTEQYCYINYSGDINKTCTFHIYEVNGKIEIDTFSLADLLQMTPALMAAEIAYTSNTMLKTILVVLFITLFIVSAYVFRFLLDNT